MKTLHFSISINAPADRVYQTMLGTSDKKDYEFWTAVFHPTSTWSGSWNEGEKICFIAINDNGKKQGLVSVITENIPASRVVIRHEGILDGEQEITEGPQVEGWKGCTEIYSFSEQNGATVVSIETETTEDYADYFGTTWNKALDKLRELVESRN